MARLSLVAFLALAFSGVALATSPDSQEVVADDGVKATASWSYSVCGTWVFTFVTQPVEPNAATQGVPRTLSPSTLLLFPQTHPSLESS